ncbi:MAG: DUF4846 domain-containing protein [Arcicella sp.]|nr:DUF4846 domain-containing protein [Arcicella sp.]
MGDTARSFRATHNSYMKILLAITFFFFQIPTFGQINPTGKIVETRFNLPENYHRLSTEKNSFGEYLRNFPLKNDKTKVYFYNGREKTNSQQIAVLDIDRGTKDLQQCADAVMRLRSEYLYKQKRIQDISFKTFGGVTMNYAQYKQGYRITNQRFKKTKGADNSREGFRKYLDMVFSYANTYTLEKEMKTVKNLKDLQIGDVFIVSNPKSYGHAMIVMDVAENQQNKDKVFLLAQSYMPAQDIHIVKNPKGGVWYSLKDLDNQLYTPEWTFPVSALHRF